MWGDLNYQVTPMLPGYPWKIPEKLMMIPSEKRTYIIELNVYLQFIDEILHKTALYNHNIESIGLYSANGYPPHMIKFLVL